MADEPKIEFEVDVGQVMVKLHLAGCETAKSAKDVKFFNSGITGMPKTPPAPGKFDPSIKFDLSNSSGKYELGVMMKPLEVELKHTQEEIAQEVADEASKAGIADDADKVKKLKEEKQKELAADNAEAEQKAEAEDRKQALVWLKAYMEAFAGKDNAAKIKDADVVKIIMPAKMNDPSTVKYNDFQIPEISASEKEDLKKKQTEQMSKDAKQKKVTIENICYKIGYTLSTKVS